MIFSMAATVTCTVEQRSQTFHETSIAYRLALIHFYLQFKPTSWSLKSKLPTQTQQMHYLAWRVSISGYLYTIQKNINSIGTEQLHLCRVVHFTRQNLMLTSPHNDQALPRGTCLLQISHWTLNNSMKHVKKRLSSILLDVRWCNDVPLACF